MLLIPAIDLKDGSCVRLKRGDMNDATVFSEDPAAMARHWVTLGARRLHLVDGERMRGGDGAGGDEGVDGLAGQDAGRGVMTHLQRHSPMAPPVSRGE